MKIVKIGKEDHEQLSNILSDIAKKANIDQVKSVNMVLKQDLGIVKYAVDVQNMQYVPGTPQQPLTGAGATEMFNPGSMATNAIQQAQKAQQTAPANTGAGVNEIANPGSMAMNAIQQTQQAGQAAQQQQADPMRGQNAEIFVQTPDGAGQLIPVLLEGSPQGDKVQVWNTQTNSKQWVDTTSVVQPGTTNPFPFQGTANQTSPGNTVVNPVGTEPVAGEPAQAELGGVAQAKQDLQEFYGRLATEKQALVQYLPMIITAISTLWDIYKSFKDEHNPEAPIEEKMASLEDKTSGFDFNTIKSLIAKAPDFLPFVQNLLENESVRKQIKKRFPDKAEIIDSIMNIGQQIIDAIQKAIEPISETEINIPKEDYKVSSDVVQLNSETILIKKGSDLYIALESKIEKIAEKNNLEGINGIKIEVTPEQLKVAYLKNEKISYNLTSKFAAGDQFPVPFSNMLGGGDSAPEVPATGGDSGGGILSTVTNVAKPIYGITKEYPNLTGGASVLGSIMLAKAQGKDWNLFDNGLVPFLAGRYGGPLTMAAVGGTQAFGVTGIKKWALILGGFILDNAMKSSMEEDENKKKALEYTQNNMNTKLYQENPQFARMVSTYLTQMKKTNPDYTFQQAQQDLSAAGVNASVFDVIEKIASIKRIKEADSVHISMNEDYAVFRFKNAVGEVDPNTGQPIDANYAPVDPNATQPTQPVAGQTTQPTGQPAQTAQTAQTQGTPETQEQQPLVSKEIEEEFKKKLDQLNNLVEQNSAAAKDVAGNPTGGEEEARAATEGLSAQITALADEIQNDTRFKPLIDQMSGQIPKEQTAPDEGQETPQQEQQPVQQE